MWASVSLSGRLLASGVPVMLVMLASSLASTARNTHFVRQSQRGLCPDTSGWPLWGMATMALHHRSIVGVFVAFLLIVGVVVGMLWWLQRQLIYFPDASSVLPAGEVILGARDVTLRTDDGLELGAWFVPAAPGAGPTGRQRMAVLVAPGNGGNRADRAGLAEELRRRGLAVLLMDYRGYGGNPGSPSEKGLECDALAAMGALEDLGYPPERTIYFGESL